MLLPGFACDQSQSPSTSLPFARIQHSSGLFVSPPASPPQMSAQSPINNLFNTCRSLQSLLSAPTAPTALSSMPSTTLPITPPLAQQQLPTPPLAHAPSPMKLRLRSRKQNNDSASDMAGSLSHSAGIARKRIVKRAQPPPRGLNKRRRAVDDDMGRDDDNDSDNESGGSAQESAFPALAPSPFGRETVSSFPSTTAQPATAQPAFSASQSTQSRPQTPKRARIAPETLPLGLERSDYHALDGAAAAEKTAADSQEQAGTNVELEADGESWSTEEDRMLVELVLEKLQLSKSDWQDCARSLGKKDRHSLGRRWKSLMLHGDIGLKSSSRSRRGKIHGTWR